jgi:hypothetical protein
METGWPPTELLVTVSITSGMREGPTRPISSSVGVVGHHAAFLAHHREQDALGGPPLVRGDDVAVTENALDGAAEALETGAARVAFVAAHHGRPLLGAHGRGAGVRQHVDQHGLGGQQEQVVVRGLQQLLALLPVRPADRLHRLGGNHHTARG